MAVSRLERPVHVAREQEIAARLAAAWRCDWQQMGPYSPFDVYLLREKRIVAFAEIKTRGDRACHTFPTVMINLDKWFTLMQAEIGLSIAGLFVVAFSDGIWWVRIGTLPVNHYKICYRGRADRPAVKNDVMPSVEVPSGEFKRLCASDGIFEQGASGDPTASP